MKQHINGMLHRACGNNFSGIHKEYLIGIGDSIKPVRYDNFCCARRKFFQDLFQEPFGDFVYIGGGFDQDQ